ncbi:hypothetical protein E2C01_055325 [Portunus trituberculatus]|uniref:Uncharacterized protein n=1 Tax=Portunus trituberculatus TaxID=210409 RepID=A0A5B7GVM2_PORTR|nr:hypothetical protein [Portunus trituberculatus]
MGCTLPTHMLPYITNTLPPQCSTCNVTLSVDISSSVACWSPSQSSPLRSELRALRLIFG